ncbi:MAG: hypothetical protein JXA20_05520 [Spirochaetes bacterium]|nr:hypothetical protein [Spirochaetota bacterium]
MIRIQSYGNYADKIHGLEEQLRVLEWRNRGTGGKYTGDVQRIKTEILQHRILLIDQEYDRLRWTRAKLVRELDELLPKSPVQEEEKSNGKKRLFSQSK